jgi:uncharacterized membrane protein YkvI
MPDFTPIYGIISTAVMWTIIWTVAYNMIIGFDKKIMPLQAMYVLVVIFILVVALISALTAARGLGLF